MPNASHIARKPFLFGVHPDLLVREQRPKNFGSEKTQSQVSGFSNFTFPKMTEIFKSAFVSKWNMQTRLSPGKVRLLHNIVTFAYRQG